MPHYTAYPTSKDTPNRNQRKAKRKAIFEANRIAAREERKARREARKAAAQ